MNPPAITTADTFPTFRMNGVKRGPFRPSDWNELGDAVPEVQADEHHRQDVEADRDGRAEVLDLEPVEVAHAVAVVVVRAVLERPDMDRDENQQREARQDHRRGGEAFLARSAGPFLPHVLRGPGPLILKRHPDRLEEVNQEDDEQSDLNGNDERIADERVRVSVERLRPEEHHHVAGDVQDQIQEEAEFR